MIDFNFSMPTEILFGKGKIEMTGKKIREAGGSRVLLCYGSSRIKDCGLYNIILDNLRQYGLEVSELSGIEPNPRIETVREAVRIAAENKADFILACGGGSVIDCAKAAAAGVYYDGDPWDFFSGKASISRALPVGAVLTIPATGSEANRYAVITNPVTRQKLAASSKLLCPVFAVMDPEYTYSLSPLQTAGGIADIMGHVFEQYFSPVKNTFTQDRIAEAILSSCIYYAPAAISEPDNYYAKGNLLWASSLALNGLLGAGKVADWAVHVIEHEISALYDITHGFGLAVLHPVWMEYVIDNENYTRFYNFAVNVFHTDEDSNQFAAALRGIEELKRFYTSMGLPENLKALGVKKNDLKYLASRASAKGPVGRFKLLNENDILEILERAY